MQLHGAWDDAHREVERAYIRLSEPPPEPAVGAAFYQQAELHRLRGAFDPAEGAYRQASQWGRPPEPGLALLRLASPLPPTGPEVCADTTGSQGVSAGTRNASWRGWPRRRPHGRSRAGWLPPWSRPRTTSGKLVAYRRVGPDRWVGSGTTPHDCLSAMILARCGSWPAFASPETRTAILQALTSQHAPEGLPENASPLSRQLLVALAEADAAAARDGTSPPIVAERTPRVPVSRSPLQPSRPRHRPSWGSYSSRRWPSSCSSSCRRARPRRPWTWPCWP